VGSKKNCTGSEDGTRKARNECSMPVVNVNIKICFEVLSASSCTITISNGKSTGIMFKTARVLVPVTGTRVEA
jgi:hypothetical protein